MNLPLKTQWEMLQRAHYLKAFFQNIDSGIPYRSKFTRLRRDKIYFTQSREKDALRKWAFLGFLSKESEKHLSFESIYSRMNFWRQILLTHKSSARDVVMREVSEGSFLNDSVLHLWKIRNYKIY